MYHIIRGEDSSEVNARTQIKSMLSAKSFRPTINSSEQAVRWLRIFVADIQSRLVEEGVLENKRRPKVLSLHHRQGAQMRSRQASIPSGRPIDENLLFDIAKNLLGQIVIDGTAWPCSNLQLSVGGFEDGPTGNRGIGGFLIRGEEARAMMLSIRDADDCEWSKNNAQPGKRRKVDHGAIQHFFSRQESHEEAFSDGADAHHADIEAESLSVRDTTSTTQEEEEYVIPLDGTSDETARKSAQASLRQASIPKYFCNACSTNILIEAKEEHEDWHLARELQAEEKSNTRSETRSDPHRRALASQSNKKSAVSKASNNNGTVQKKMAHVEKGQKTLAFSAIRDI